MKCHRQLAQRLLGLDFLSRLTSLEADRFPQFNCGQALFN